MSEQHGADTGRKPDEKRPALGPKLVSVQAGVVAATAIVGADFTVVYLLAHGRLALVLALSILAFLVVSVLAAALIWQRWGRVRVVATMAGITLLVLALIAGTGLYFSGTGTPAAFPHPSGKPSVGTSARPSAKPSATPSPCRTSGTSTRQNPDTYFASLTVPDGYPVYSVAYSPDGTWLAVASDNVTWSDPPVNHAGSLTLWQVTCAVVAVQHQVTTLTDPDSNGVWKVAFSPDGKYLAAADGNHTTYVWALSGAAPRQVARFPDLLGADIATIAFGAHDTLFTSDIDGGVYEWDIATRSRLGQFITPQPPDVGLYSMAVSPDGRTLAVGYSSGVICLWRIAADARVTLPAQDSAGVTALAFGGRDGDTLAAGSLTGSTYLWDLTSDSLITSVPSGASQQVDDVAFNPAGTVLAVATATTGTADTAAGYGYVYLWHTATWASMGSRQYGGEPAVFGLAFSPDGETLATSDFGASAYLWTMPRSP